MARAKVFVRDIVAKEMPQPVTGVKILETGQESAIIPYTTRRAAEVFRSGVRAVKASRIACGGSEKSERVAAAYLPRVVSIIQYLSLVIGAAHRCVDAGLVEMEAAPIRPVISPEPFLGVVAAIVIVAADNTYLNPVLISTGGVPHLIGREVAITRFIKTSNVEVREDALVGACRNDGRAITRGRV